MLLPVAPYALPAGWTAEVIQNDHANHLEEFLRYRTSSLCWYLLPLSSGISGSNAWSPKEAADASRLTLMATSASLRSPLAAEPKVRDLVSLLAWSSELDYMGGLASISH